MRRDIIGKALLDERMKREMHQSEVAYELGYSISTISNMERGLSNVSYEKYRAYAKFMEKSDLVGIENEMEKRKEAVMQELRHSEDIVRGNPHMAEELIEGLSDLNLFPEAKIFATFLRGRIAFERKVYDMSKKYLEDAFEKLTSVPEFEQSNLQAICLNDLGRIAFYEKDFEGALQYADKAIALFKDSGERSKYKPHPYFNKALYLEELGRDEEACQTLEYLYRHIDKFQTNLSVVIQIYERFANLLAKSGSPLKALEYAQEGLQIASDNREYRRLFSIWSIMGNIYNALGQAQEAKMRFRKALALSTRIAKDSPSRIAQTHLEYGKLLIDLGEIKQAEEQLENSVKFFQSTKRKSLHLIEALVTLGRLKKDKEMVQIADEFLMEYNNTENVPVDFFLRMCDFYESVDEQKFKYYQDLMYHKLKEGLK